MKRKISVMALMMLVATLMMFGCGSSGGGGSTDTTTSVGGSSGDNGGIVVGGALYNSGYIMFNFQQEPSKVSAIMKNASYSTLPTAQWVRVVIRHIAVLSDPDVGDYTIMDYKQIQDFDLSLGTTATMAVNPGSDYQVDVISYLKASDHNTLLKHGNKTGIVVVAGQTTLVSIITAPFDAGLAPPNPIASGATYVVQSNYGGAPLRNEKNLLVSDTAISGVFAYDAKYSSFVRTAPVLTVGDTSKTIYFQGLFFLADDLLDPAKDNWQNWRYYEPNPTEFGDSQLTSTITPPGAISIDVTL